MHETPLTGLVLSGGGARAAYQVGVLRALAGLHAAHRARHGEAACRNPFGVICGTSAGAINAAALACNADRFDAAVDHLSQVWAGFEAAQVYRSDPIGVLRSGAQWLGTMSLGWLLARWAIARPKSLLDNAPLAELLQRLVPLERLPEMLRHRHLSALAVTASSYTHGEHVTFYQSAAPIQPYERSQRAAVAASIGVSHLMASSAIPFVFPAARIEGGDRSGWYGDGTMRQTAPISPAIHLGAQRLLVIGVGRLHEGAAQPIADGAYPSLAQIGGHAMSSIFLDALASDIERLERINRTLELLTPTQRMATPLRPIQALVISPSQRLDDIAARHQGCLPGPVRTLLRGVGSSSTAGDTRGAALASYLLFEAPYTQELIALGEADTLSRASEVRAFFGWDGEAQAAAARARQPAASTTG